MQAIRFSFGVLFAFALLFPTLAQDRQAPEPYTLDESIFDVPEGSNVVFYQSLERELQRAFMNLPQDEEAAKELRGKINQAFRDVNRNLAFNCANASDRVADAAFIAYCRALSTDLNITEMKSILEREKANAKPNLDRIARLEEMTILTEITAAGRSEDPNALADVADEMIERALAEPSQGEHYANYVSKFAVYDRDAAERFVRSAEERFNASGDRVLRRIALSLRGKERYAELVGSEMQIEGLTVLGKEFDWSAYRGKVVLVLFFDTTNRKAAEFFQKPLSLFSAYHSAGFEIVGYCADDDPKAVEMFDRRYPYPWTTVSRLLSRNAEDKEYVDLTAFYGFQTLPIAVLIDKDGKVVGTKVTNSQVEEYLFEQFPDVERP